MLAVKMEEFELFGTSGEFNSLESLGYIENAILFPEAVDEIERHAECLPWLHSEQKRKLFDFIEGDRVLKEYQFITTDLPEHPRPGNVYQLDHVKMPLEISSRLTSLRVALVESVTESQVILKFPSLGSIETFLKQNAERFRSMGSSQQADAIMGTKPELDEELIVTLKVAEQILMKPVTCTELLHQGHRKEFWLLDEEDDTGHVINTDSPKRWAVRRKRKRVHVRPSKENVRLRLVVSAPLDETPAEPASPSCKVSNPAVYVPRDIQGRWTARRYATAQMKLCDILLQKGAKPGDPIPRAELRTEARKFIGDTGLLDHLLKHLVDKVIDGGKRFRRRYNSDGNMEYWIEDANLMDLRKAAGVQDPFWIPPPGWKPGDKIHGAGMHPAEAAEMERLKKEVTDLRRDFLRIAEELFELKWRYEEHVGAC